MHGKNTRKFPVMLSSTETSKTSCFSFYLYLLCFLFYKIRDQEGGTGSAGGRRDAFGTGGRW
jgi:hypothetical protein